jgi:hypothetical protein
MKKLIKELLRESLISEVGELSNPRYKKGQFHFHKFSGNNYETFFYDEVLDKNINIAAYVNPMDDTSYSFSFGVDGRTISVDKTDVRHYFQILATVKEALMQFLEEVQPDYVDLAGADARGKKGQKDNIYHQVIEKNAAELRALGYELADPLDSPALKKIENN